MNLPYTMKLLPRHLEMQLTASVMTELIFTEQQYICFIQISFLKTLVVAGCLKDALLRYVVG